MRTASARIKAGAQTQPRRGAKSCGSSGRTSSHKQEHPGVVSHRGCSSYTGAPLGDAASGASRQRPRGYEHLGLWYRHDRRGDICGKVAADLGSGAAKPSEWLMRPWLCAGCAEQLAQPLSAHTDSLADRDNPLGHDSRAGRDSLDNRCRLESPRRADRGSRHGTCLGTLAQRDSRANNAPPVVDRSDVLGPPAVEHRRDLQCYSACEPRRSGFEQKPSVHLAPPPSTRPAQPCKAA
jgi:hypothetical protein